MRAVVAFMVELRETETSSSRDSDNDRQSERNDRINRMTGMMTERLVKTIPVPAIESRLKR
jgi:hypothetical protein